jgi:hypothetical protein
MENEQKPDSVVEHQEPVIPAITIRAEDLDDRQIRGLARAKSADKSNGNIIIQNDSTSIWMSGRSNRAWKVERDERNHRGTMKILYTCSCGDWDKNGLIDCHHVFAERVRRGEVVIVGTVSKYRVKRATAVRRPPRERATVDGRPWRSVQRSARVQLPDRIPELLRDLARAMEK